MRQTGGVFLAAARRPLRGGKASNWQGGIRVNAWVSGGALPAAMNGKKLEGLTCVWVCSQKHERVGWDFKSTL